MARDTISDDSDNAHSASNEQPALTAAQAAAVAIERLAELTSNEIQGVTSVEPTEDGWVVEIDLDENLLAYRRIKRYIRGSTDIGSRERR